MRLFNWILPLYISSNLKPHNVFFYYSLFLLSKSLIFTRKFHFFNILFLPFRIEWQIYFRYITEIENSLFSFVTLRKVKLPCCPLFIENVVTFLVNIKCLKLIKSLRNFTLYLKVVNIFGMSCLSFGELYGVYNAEAF